MFPRVIKIFGDTVVSGQQCDCIVCLYMFVLFVCHLHLPSDLFSLLLRNRDQTLTERSRSLSKH